MSLHIVEPPAVPVLAVVAGPNGSGKSTFYRQFLQSTFPVFVNADVIARGLDQFPESDRSRVAADLAQAERDRRLAEGASFAMETVFSRTDYWLDYLRRARLAGFRVMLFFICTEDPVLNVGRVATRVAEGGHPVPTPKVLARYAGSIRTAVESVAIVNELWLYDNSPVHQTPLLLARFIEGRSGYFADVVPRWASPFVPSA